MNEDFYPTKSYFEKAEQPMFFYVGSQSVISYVVSHVEKRVLSGKSKIRSNKKGMKFFTIPKIKEKGLFGIEIEGEKKKLFSSFDIGISPLANPHYGFLTDFAADNDDNYLDFLLKMHINIVQDYDWMYRHEDYIAPSNPFIDPMGKTKSQEVLAKRINNCHKAGILSFAYGAIYGATNGFAQKHPSWRLFDGTKRPLTFIDRFTIMNFVSSPWRDLLIENYCKAISKMKFDGIHMDTYGSPKEAFSNKGELIRFEKEFVPLINEVSSKIRTLNGSVTFNNVGAWPLERTAKARDAFDYAEIWDPLNDYQDLLSLTRWQRSLTKKPFVIAAYLKPYYEDNDLKAAYSNALLSSLLYAAGSHHLIYGEDGRVLRTGYYPDNHKLSKEAFELLRTIEDFAFRYGEILFDPQLEDVSLTHAGGENKEYVFSNVLTSSKPESGNFLAIIREKENEKVINLINLKDQRSTVWNADKNPVLCQRGPKIEILVNKPGYVAFEADPLAPEMKSVSLQEKQENNGVRVCLESGNIGIWKMIVLQRKKD